VRLIGRDKDNALSGDWSFSLFTYRYPLTGQNKYLVLPPVRMRWGGTARFNLKDTHTKTWCPIISVNNLTLDYSG